MPDEKERLIKSCGKCHSDVLASQETCHRCGDRRENYDSRYFWLKKENA